MAARKPCANFAWRDEDPAYRAERENDRIVFRKIRKMSLGGLSADRAIAALFRSDFWQDRMHGKTRASWKRCYYRWRAKCIASPPVFGDTVQAKKCPFDPCKHGTERELEKFYQESFLSYRPPTAMVPSAERKTQMTSEYHAMTEDVTKAMMKMLRQPVLSTFLIAFNQHEGPAGDMNPANPFFGFFALMDRLRTDLRRGDALTPKRKTMEVPEDAVRVDATDPELENCIAEALADMMSVLHPDQASVVESEPVRTFFKSVREANYRLRKAEALKWWKESERKRMKIERMRAMLNRTRSYQHA